MIATINHGWGFIRVVVRDDGELAFFMDSGWPDQSTLSLYTPCVKLRQGLSFPQDPGTLFCLVYRSAMGAGVLICARGHNSHLPPGRHFLIHHSAVYFAGIKILP